MKYHLTLIIAIFLCSCSGAKKVIENQPKQTKTVTEVPKNDSPVLKPTPVESSKTQNTITEQSENIEDSITKHNTTIESFNHMIWQELLKQHVSKNGNVDYSAFKNDSKQLRQYIDALNTKTPTEKWSKEDKLAYWINAYNALTIDLILRNYPLNSIKDIKDPWDQRLWKFGNKWLNLNDIEHQILRKMEEPRIHFAIVCASESCPKLLNEAFTAGKLEVQLTNATKTFLSDTTKNEISENNIKLSKIFKWFAKDFKNDGSLIDFLNQYSEVTIINKAKKSFKDYDWSLNN
ncbi:DUF547 domain-containing protein [Winogradskyella sp.]|uniref:DUF547 domain-containing protein n=1 Tax=Winogradskyella sp. TaxID=1883156 RepID=UPI002612B357|nr:DUF547 domain-containing protein [Winogradskyella sp.]